MVTNNGTIFTGDMTIQAPLALPSPADVSGPHRMHNLPRPASHRFVGRDRELAILEQALHARNERTATQVVTQTMSGLGGVGKTTLALHYAHSHRPDYTTVWWINAETPETITESLAQLTTRANPGTDTGSAAGEALAQWALAWLDTHPGWLLVFDNATHPDHLAPYLARLTNGHKIITSRLTHDWDTLADRPLHLDVLPRPAAISLLCQLARRDDPTEHPAAGELADELGHLPLALEQAGTHIRRTRGTYSGYLKRFRTQTARMLNTPGNGDPHRTTIARTWRITLDTIADRDPLAVHFLQIMAWLAPHDIPRDLLDGLADDPGAEADALALLNDFSMISLTESTATTHRLVQAVARTPDPHDPHRTEPAIDKAQSCATTLLRGALPHKPLSNVAGWARWRALLPHIDAYFTHAHPDTDTADTSFILYTTSRFLLGQGQFSQASRYAHRSAATSERIHGDDHPDTLAYRTNLANLYQIARDLDQAIPIYERTLTDTVRIYGEVHPETVFARMELARAYQAVGDLNRAIPMLEQALTDTIRIHGEDPESTLFARVELARAYQAVGDLNRAVPMLEQALTDTIRIHREDPLQILINCRYLAGAYHTAGNLQRAIAMYEQALNDSTRVLGEDHLQTMISRISLAGVYQAAGDLKRSIPMLEQALNDCIRIYGDNHPDIFTYRKNLADAYRAAGDLSRAIPIYEQALTDSMRFHGDNHPHIFTYRKNLADAYQAAGNLGSAIPMYEQALTDTIRILGEDHLKTLAYRINLADAYKTAGDLSRAIPIYEQALTDSVRFHGEGHPIFWTSFFALAGAYDAAGDLDRAIPMYELILGDFTQKVGESHKITRMVWNRLQQARAKQR
ncbi:tetratricopeptide repeat protein [Streptomyces niveus]|uniref:tetratricopeptide repeat protein n=1 Tax=Streptomyces niveus TaxID=193462 RepID=UPI00341E6E82